MTHRHPFVVVALLLTLVLGLVLPAWTEDAKGRIAAVTPDKNEFVLTENFKNWTVQLDKAGKVFINNREAKLADLQVGDEAMVTFARDGERLIASVVRGMRE